MKTRFLLPIFIALLTSVTFQLFAQGVLIAPSGTPASTIEPSAMLEVRSNAQGLLIPRLTQSEMTAIQNPANGLLVFCTSDDNFYAYMANGSIWKPFCYCGNGICNVVVSIAASANPVCAGVTVTFTATQTNGGTSPVYHWKVNSLNVGGNASAYSFIPVNGDIIECVLTSDAPCAIMPTVNSNQITMIVNPSGVSCPGTPTVSYGGQVYNTVLIGTQCWFKENLNVGTMIELPQPQANNGIIEKYCYNNDLAKCNIYGGLYFSSEQMNWSVIPGSQGICPSGWHIPTHGDWTTLTTFLGGLTVAGGTMKEAGTTHWQLPNTGATNCSGFTALPGGSSGHDGIVGFNGINQVAWFWTSSVDAGIYIHSRQLDYNSDNVYSGSVVWSSCMAVRCLKD